MAADLTPVPDASTLAGAAVLPAWHRDVAALDEAWADRAAATLSLLARSDQHMVQANAKGSDGERNALAYASLLDRMKGLEEETLQGEKKPWVNAVLGKLPGATQKRPLVDRMNALMQDRFQLIDGTRQRIHGLREALDMRAKADEQAMELLEDIPRLEALARHRAQETRQELAAVDATQDFARFRDVQLRHRQAQRLPEVLLAVRHQLQNAVMMGAPLRDAVDGYLHIEELNQTNFELTFGAHVSNLAVLQGMKKSALNAQTSAAAMKMLPALLPASEHNPGKEGGSSFSRAQSSSSLKEQLEHRRGEPKEASSLPRIRIRKI